MRRQNHQLNLPPAEVEPINRQAKATPRNLTGDSENLTAAAKLINPLRWLRLARERAKLSQRYLASRMEISEQLLSAQLSDHEPDKHLSLRRLGRVPDRELWKEFFLLGLEDLGFKVVVMEPEQFEARNELQRAVVNYMKAMTK
jgi:transcriptional regulator with XRE-family HTH domain